MNASPATCLFLADVLLLLHFAIVSFLVVGLILIWIGRWLHWRWIYNGWFRLVHLLVMGMVAVQAVAQLPCPLTVWEWELRQMAGQVDPDSPGFIQYWVQRMMFYDLPSWIFATLYIVFFILILYTARAVRPRWPWEKMNE